MLCLKVTTDARWASRALSDLDALLIDHAHCEMKAASNALSLAMRYGDSAVLVGALTNLAREEIDHFQRVFAVLAARGTALRPPAVDLYAAELRVAAQGLPRDRPAAALVDRLLVGALIEARSCERFKLLAAAASAKGEEYRRVGALWHELLASEAAHYRTFVDLALAAGGDRPWVMARLERLAESEGAIVRALAGERSDALPAERARIHG